MYLNFYNNYTSKCFSNKFGSVRAVSVIDSVVFFYFILRIFILQISPQPSICLHWCEPLPFSSFCPMIYFHFTIPAVNLGSNRKWFKLPNLPLNPPTFQAHHRCIVLNKISSCLPLLFLLAFSFTLKSRVHYPSLSYTFPQFTWPFFLLSQHLAKLQTSTSSITHLRQNVHK